MEARQKLSRAQWSVVLAAFALTSVSMGKMIVIAGFSDFSHEYESVPMVTKQLLISISSLSGIPVVLLMGRMERYLSKKTLGLLSSLLFAVGGCVPIFTESFGLMFAARCVMGFGMAMCSTLATSVLVEHFSGEQRSRLVGYCSAVKSLFGIGFSYFGGVLATYAWRDAYWLYAIGFLVMLAVLICLPDDRSARPALQRENEAAGGAKLSFPVWYYSFSAMLMFVFFSAHGNNISLLFEENSVGTAAQAGIASALFTVGGFLSGLVFYRVYRRVSAYTLALGYLLAGVSILLMSFPASCGMVYVESFVFGLGFYLIIPHQTLLITAAVPKQAYTLAVAIHLSAINLGQVLSPMVLNRLSVLFCGEGVPGRYRVAGVGLLLMALAAGARVAVAKRKEPGMEAM